jgi:hypothetical protein
MIYYDLFGVPRDASDRDIRRAFKKLAVKHHPDKGGRFAAVFSLSLRCAPSLWTRCTLNCTVT